MVQNESNTVPPDHAATAASIVGPRADPGVQAVRMQVIFKSSLGSRLPLLSARPAVTFSAEEHHRPSTSTKLYCLVTVAHRCERLAQCYPGSHGENQAMLYQ